jgi:protein O-mannosyl-transferase
MSEKEAGFFEQNKQTIVVVALAVLVVAVYWQAVGFEFINFDDNIYVYENPFVNGGLNKESIYWAFTQFHSANWHPLTWMSHQLDVTLFGLNAGSHHATNIIFHSINTVLAFAVFNKLTRSVWKSAVIAALFAIHPAHVESVAWVAERKDVLSTMFWLLTMLAYTAYARKQMSERSSVAFYVLTIVLFALGLMAKPMLVTLPFVLLLLDFWSLERIKSLRDLQQMIVEKLPFFALGAASSYVTVLAQRSAGAVQTLEILPAGMRISNAIVAYAQYIIALVYPTNLSVWYPYNKSISTIQIIGAAALLIVISAICIWQIKDRKYLLFGWLWFLGTLVPVIGFVQVGVQSHADRYTYIPFFGLFVMIVWGVEDLLQRRNLILKAAAVAVILLLSVICFHQVSLWKNNETLYKHSISVTQGNYLLLQNYCHTLILQNRIDEAEVQCRDSISANPEYSESHNSLGIIQIKRQQFADASESFRNAIKYDPGFAMYKVNLAVALASLGNVSEAEDNLRVAADSISYKVHTEIWVQAIAGLAKAYAAKGNLEKASENFVRVLSIAPERSDIRTNFAATLYTMGKFDDAQQQIESSINQNSNLPESRNIYGLILLKQGKRDQAINEFKKALQLKQDFSEADNNLKKAIRGETIK